MLSGAAKTLTEIETQIHPRTWTRRGPCTPKCVTKSITAKEVMFIAENSLIVKFCTQHVKEKLMNKYIFKVNEQYNWNYIGKVSVCLN